MRAKSSDLSPKKISQSAGIVTQKVNEICRLIPAFSREIVWSNRGKTGAERTKQTKDSVAFSFRNGSVLENVAASEHTRGRRFHSGLIEESIGVDENILNTVIIPTLNVERRVNGKVDPNEWVNQSQIYVKFCCQKVINIYNLFLNIV